LLLEPEDYEELHDLLKLWKPCRKILQNISKQGFWPKDPVELLDNVEAIIQEFHDRDPDGFRFRYALTTRRSGLLPALSDDFEAVDLGNLHYIMQKISSFLEGQADGIQHYLDNQPD
jgi:hypothetical protein